MCHQENHQLIEIGPPVRYIGNNQPMRMVQHLRYNRCLKATTSTRAIVPILSPIIQLWTLLLIVVVTTTNNIQFVTCKVTSGSFRLSGTKSEYLLSSFAILPTGAQATITFRSKQMYENEMSLQIHIYRDYPNYEYQFKKQSTCESKIKHANNHRNIIGGNPKVNFEYNKTTSLWESTSTILVSNTEYDDAKDKKDISRVHYWYFIIDDCSLEQYFQDHKIPTVSYTISIQNFIQQHRKRKEMIKELGNMPKTHLSADQMFLERTHILVMLVSAIIVIRLVYYIITRLSYEPSIVGQQQNQKQPQQKQQQIHIAVVWIVCTAVLDLLSSFMEIIHLDLYHYNGIGSYVCDAFAAYFESICDSLLIVFLLSIGSGWTIVSSKESTIITMPDRTMANPIQTFIFTYFANPLQHPSASISSSNNNISGTRNSGKESSNNILVLSSFVSSPCIAIVLIHLGLAQWGRIYNDDQESYHDYEHLPGKILMMIRIMLGILFYIATYQMQLICKSTTDKRFKLFYKHMGMIGLLWFLSLPMLTFVCNTFVPYYIKLPTVFIGSCIIQSLSLVLLAWLVTGHPESSIYHQYSHLSQQHDQDRYHTLSDAVLLSSHTNSHNNNNSTFKASTTSSTSTWSSFSKSKIRYD